MVIGNVWRQHQIHSSRLKEQPVLVRDTKVFLFFQQGFPPGLEDAPHLTSIFLISHQFAESLEHFTQMNSVCLEQPLPQCLGNGPGAQV